MRPIPTACNTWVVSPRFSMSQVFMISYMIDRKGYLITNREVRAGMQFRAKRGFQQYTGAVVRQPHPKTSTL